MRWCGTLVEYTRAPDELALRGSCSALCDEVDTLWTLRVMRASLGSCVSIRTASHMVKTLRRLHLLRVLRFLVFVGPRVCESYYGCSDLAPSVTPEAYFRSSQSRTPYEMRNHEGWRLGREVRRAARRLLHSRSAAIAHMFFLRDPLGASLKYTFYQKNGLTGLLLDLVPEEAWDRNLLGALLQAASIDAPPLLEPCIQLTWRNLAVLRKAQAWRTWRARASAGCGGS